MESLLEQLRALGVHIPQGLSNEQLANLGKVLNPWRVTVLKAEDADQYFAGTKAHVVAQFAGGEASAVGKDIPASGATPAEAVMTLLLSQLTADYYPASATSYKQDSMSFRANNPN